MTWPQAATMLLLARSVHHANFGSEKYASADAGCLAHRVLSQLLVTPKREWRPKKATITRIIITMIMILVRTCTQWQARCRPETLSLRRIWKCLWSGKIPRLRHAIYPTTMTLVWRQGGPLRGDSTNETSRVRRQFQRLQGKTGENKALRKHTCHRQISGTKTFGKLSKFLCYVPVHDVEISVWISLDLCESGMDLCVTVLSRL